MAYSRIAFFIAAAAFLSAHLSCGGDDEVVLAEGVGIEVTEDDFHREFDNLLPDDQVSVLEPGGKLALVTRMAYREALLAEAEKMELPELEDWMEMSRELWLAREWLEQELEDIYSADLDTSWIDSLMSIETSLSAVLMRDSLSALEVLGEWKDIGPRRPDEGMSLAPWSREGSSYLDFQGSCFTLYSIDSDMARVMLEHAGLGPSMAGLYGAWAVFTVDTALTETPQYSVPAAARYYISSKLDESRGITVLSPGVEELAEHLVRKDERYSFTSLDELDPGLQVATYPGGDLTADEVVGAAMMVRDENFFHGVPEELAPGALPRPMLGPAIDLWVYVENLAELERQADLAEEEGISWPEEEMELTVTDIALKNRVLGEGTPVDTATALDYYRENADLYQIPELRSIEVAYVPYEWMPEGSVSSFDDLEIYYSRSDSLGNLVPTEPCPREMYPYGEQVFEAEEGVFTGPVDHPEDEVFVFFRVVDIIPEGETDPMYILPRLMEDCRRVMVNRRLEDYLLELWDTYSIEIDSARVRELDPWSSVY